MRNPFKLVLYKLRRAYYWYVQEPQIEKERVKLRESLEKNYENWITAVEAGYEKIDISKLDYQPLISIIVPVYNVLDRHLIPCIESVLEQEYSNWELCLADDCSTWDNVKTTLQKYETNPKIKIVYREKNGHISECTNSALQLATGEFVAFLDCDDVLAPNALSEVVKILNENQNLDFIYSDEDKIDDDGKNRHMPHFKSDWAPDTFMSFMYTCHLSIFRKSIIDELGGVRKGYEGAQDYDLTLRFTEKTDRIYHIPKILYHWRERAESTASCAQAKDYVIEAARKSKEEALVRRGLKAELEWNEREYQFHVNYVCDNYPKVSIIIPSKDNYKTLKQCLKSLRTITSYPDYEIIIVDNGSNDENRCLYQDLIAKMKAKYVYEPKDFNFSYMCNLGASHAEGEYFLFLNDDIEILHSDWLTRMVGQAVLLHTGAVGAKLLYPDKKSIQHAGVMIIPDGPVHALGGMSDTEVHGFFRNTSNYNYIAVTGACLLISKEKFNEVEGLYEGLPVAYNDIDLCFKLSEAGYYNVVRNDVVLIHHESVSRGYDHDNEEKMQRLNRERNELFKRHPQYKNYDPFYNVNLAKHKVDFSYAYDDENLRVTCNKVYEIDEIKDNPEKVMYTIDEIKEYRFYYRIRGWMFVQEEYMSDLWEAYVILKDTNTQKIFECETRMERRLDVQKAMEQYGHFEFTGFDCLIEKGSVPQGSYEILLRTGDYVVKTDKILDVDEWRN
ncbi:MAG: glycosyltransferase [Lachnospiraceae bacterium]|nr:glycosyltransferase [Lachnospiraceae bacterium]